MAILLVQHKVKDYAEWKKGFDAAYDFRKSAGEVAVKIYRNVSDPNMLTIFNTWDSLANAQKFAHSPELKDVMEKLGVLGAPTVAFLNES
jgi:quinol monooxygenase YgiN